MVAALRLRILRRALNKRYDMTSKKFIRHAAAAVITLATVLPWITFAQDIRADVQKSIFPCHDAVFYNNGNRDYRITFDYEYTGADGSRYSWRDYVTAVRGQKTVHYMPGQTVDCSKT